MIRRAAFARAERVSRASNRQTPRARAAAINRQQCFRHSSTLELAIKPVVRFGRSVRRKAVTAVEKVTADAIARAEQLVNRLNPRQRASRAPAAVRENEVLVRGRKQQRARRDQRQQLMQIERNFNHRSEERRVGKESKSRRS